MYTNLAAVLVVVPFVPYHIISGNVYPKPRQLEGYQHRGLDQQKALIHLVNLIIIMMIVVLKTELVNC
jgi:hypothetical protein